MRDCIGTALMPLVLDRIGSISINFTAFIEVAAIGASAMSN